MDASAFGLDGEYLLGFRFPQAARVVLSAGREREGTTPDYHANLADASRQAWLRAALRRMPPPHGVTPATILLYYEEAFLHSDPGEIGAPLREAATAFAGSQAGLALQTNWPARMIKARLDPVEVWLGFLLGATVVRDLTGIAAALRALEPLLENDVRLPALRELAGAGPVPGVLTALDDDSLAQLHTICLDHHNADGVIATALEWLDRFSDDAAMTDTLGGTLESLLLGGPGMPRVQHLHAHSIGKMLLDMSLNVPADHDPDGAWRRRRLLAEMKGGKSGEYTLINIPHLGIDPAQVPDAMYFLMAEAMLFRSQALPLARRTLEYLCSRGTHTDPRPHLLHAFVNLLAGERMLAWADLITARRFSPRVSGQQADRVRKTHFRDTPGTFGLPDDAPIAIAIDRLLDGKPVEAREACVAALGELPAGERETMLELRLALGETAFPVSRPDRKLLDSLGRTMTVLEKHRPADGNWHAAMAADRLAAAVTARALEAADAASSADAGLYFAQALKLQSLRQAFGGASRIPDREASRVWAGLLQRSMPDDPAAGVLPAHLYTALDVPPLGLDDPAPFDAPWSVEFARMLAGWQHVPTDGDAPAALDPAEDPDLSTVDVRNARSAGLANEATPADDTPWLPGRPIALEKLRALLRPNDVFIEYALFPDAAFAVVIRRSGDGIVRIPLDQPLGPIARHAWACLAQPPAYPLNWDLEADCWPLRLLHAVLLGPLTGYLGNANRLIVAPHGPLHRIPFGTLHDGHGFLAEQFEIIQVPSAGAWGHLAVSPGPFPLESLAITDVDGEWGDALPGANRLVQLCPRGQQFDGVSMAADRAIEIAASAAFIHLSARGFLDADFPLFSPLFLGKGPAEARAVLMPYQLAQAPAMPVLLTVDGFASEVSREGADREAIHPCAGFHAFGASNVISTAWRSDPAVIGELFASFYDELDSNPVARAMRAAQATIRNRGETSHPYYWGAPVFSGEGNASIKNLRKSGVI